MISSLSYTPDGEKMTLAKKRSLIQQIQGNMIRQYDEIFSSETSATVIDGNLSESEVFSQALAVLS